ncbi:hypothetical protein GLV98_06950 [Halobacillus litoralis]|uniref:YtxH domain-containing protein n=1 Tax=Halobacillus litoralis TaxID=45668 RepID=A0A845E0T7_9BACI|nr:YtxH domain-containing protein [Halobacillus litoralis]MYL49215.1 hypothetical protein [Halobacillus litoralis]
MSESKTQLTHPTNEENKQQETESKSNHRVTKAIVGGVLGAAAGYFLKPNRAEEQKGSMKEKAEKAGGHLKDLKNQTKDKTSEMVGRVKDKVKSGSDEEEEKEETPSLNGADLSQKQLESPDEAAATEETDHADDEQMGTADNEETEEEKTENEGTLNNGEEEDTQESEEPVNNEEEDAQESEEPVNNEEDEATQESKEPVNNDENKGTKETVKTGTTLTVNDDTTK